MEIYFKQSVGCVYKNLRDPDYKAYTYYDKGQKLVADHPQCTHDQITQGYAIEFLVIATIIALSGGIYDRHASGNDKLGLGGGLTAAVFVGLVSMLVLNLVTMLFPLVASIAMGLLTLSAVFVIGRHIDNPLNWWRQYQAEKERLAQKRLKEAQAEINRLRASDPNLNEALKSLDAMTTALHD